MTAVDEILVDPTWLPHRLSDNAQTIVFRRTPREAHRGATFLDDASLGPGEMIAIPVAATRELKRTGGPHFVFHSAFCCSTLLARAIDVPGVAMGLKEPAILNDLAAHWRQRGSIAALPQILALLSRPFDADVAVIVKPSNVANALIDAILAADADTRVLLLYAPLRMFLVSVAKKGMWGRIWVRQLYQLLAQNQSFYPGFSERELFAQSDMQIAALGWLQQHAQFAKIAAQYDERVRTLDSEALLARREEVFSALGQHFELPFDDEVGNVFDEHSKRLGERYDQAARTREAQESADAHRDEIDMVVRWASAIAEQFGIPLVLDYPLV